MATATITPIKRSGLVAPRTFAGGIAILADSVNLDQPTIDGMAQVLYGIEDKKRPTYVGGGYYSRTGVRSGEIKGALNKGILATGDGLIVTGTAEMPTRIHDCGQDGIFITGNKALVEYVEIQRLGLASMSGGKTPHADGTQIAGGTGHIIRHSKYILPHMHAQGIDSNSCIYIESDFGPIGTVEIADVVLDGGLFSLFVTVGKFGPPEKVTLRSVTFGRCFYGSVNWELDNLPPWLELIDCQGMTDSPRF